MTDRLRIDIAEYLRPASEISEFVRRVTKDVKGDEIAGRYPEASQRRKFSRFSIPLRLEVQHVDERCRRTGQCYSVIAYDISAGGIGIRDTRSVTCKYLALHMTGPAGDEQCVLVEVTRCESRGRVFEIGGRFVTKDEPTASCDMSLEV